MYAVVAMVVGFGLGLATGGRIRHLGERSFHWVGLLLVGVGLQVATSVVHLPRVADEAMVLASYVVLAAFAASNLRLTGMGVVLVGLALNFAPIALDGGMPVRASAIVRAGIVKRADQVAHLSFGGKRHLERPSDRLTGLADILPDWVFHEVLSFGDLVMSVGIAAVCANLLRRPRGGATQAEVQPAPARDGDRRRNG